MTTNLVSVTNREMATVILVHFNEKSVDEMSHFSEFKWGFLLWYQVWQGLWKSSSQCKAIK